MKIVDTVTFTFRGFGAFRFTFFCDLPVLFTTRVAVRLQLVVSCHQTLSITISPSTLLVSTCWKRQLIHIIIIFKNLKPIMTTLKSILFCCSLLSENSPFTTKDTKMHVTSASIVKSRYRDTPYYSQLPKQYSKSLNWEKVVQSIVWTLFI